ncbi:MAG: hypothetical protein JWR16_486 [Nevskia sp.]|nr:hypothetical protein [Nevskia sp.]
MRNRRLAGLLAGLLIATASVASVASAATPVAAAHSEDWCADSVDFAMRTAQRRDEGTQKPALAAEIHRYFPVFQQQYPTLVERDMQHLVDAVYQRHWSRFKAAIGASKACGPLQSAANLAAAHASADGSLQ